MSLNDEQRGLADNGVDCSTCRGSGRLDDPEGAGECFTCGGFGKVMPEGVGPPRKEAVAEVTNYAPPGIVKPDDWEGINAALRDQLALRGSQLKAAIERIAELDQKVRHYESAICFPNLLRALQGGGTAKEIDTEKVAAVLSERDALRVAGRLTLPLLSTLGMATTLPESAWVLAQEKMRAVLEPDG